MSEDRKTLEGCDVIRTPEDFEHHMNHHRDQPAWLLVSPTLFPGVYMLEHGRVSLTPTGEICRAFEVQLDALAEQDAEGMLRGWLELAPHMRGMLGRMIRDVEADTERRTLERAATRH